MEWSEIESIDGERDQKWEQKWQNDDNKCVSWTIEWGGNKG